MCESQITNGCCRNYMLMWDSIDYCETYYVPRFVELYWLQRLSCSLLHHHLGRILGCISGNLRRYTDTFVMKSYCDLSTSRGVSEVSILYIFSSFIYLPSYLPTYLLTYLSIFLPWYWYWSAISLFGLVQLFQFWLYIVSIGICFNCINRGVWCSINSVHIGSCVSWLSTGGC